jgi:thymidylate synthase (FAD)
MKAELIDMMGDDLTVVNAARVSFNKQSEWEWDEYKESGVTVDATPVLSEKDQKLINYLAKHDHWTPFSHVMIQMRETVPIFVARQRFKHVIGFTYNEESRRYVDDAPKFFIPDAWRLRSKDKKQGSSDEVLNDIHKRETEINYSDLLEGCLSVYNDLLNKGVAPEQARMVLPQSMYTSYYVTGSLAAYARAFKLRSEEYAQKEIQDLAEQWNEIISNIPEVKHSWQALTST